MLTGVQFFAGSAGITYGCNTIMPFLWSGTYSSGLSIVWYKAINLPGAQQMQFIKKAIMDRGAKAMFSRVPDQSLIVGDTGEFRACAS